MTEPVGVALPLVAVTVAVTVRGELCAIVEAEVVSVVVVPTTLGFGLTTRLKVALCTRSPLTAQRVTGMVADEEVDDALSVRIEKPLLKLGELNEAVTPAGRPDTLRVTVPKLNEFTCTVAVARPEDIVYLPLSRFTLKSEYDAAGAAHDAVAAADAEAHTEL